MAAFQDLWPLQDDGEFLSKVAGAVVSAAIVVSLEDPGTTNHEKRYKWAAHAVRNPVSEARAILLSVAVGQKGEPIESIKLLDDETIEALVMSRIDLYAEGIA